jgi:hypothetical protein
VASVIIKSDPVFAGSIALKPGFHLSLSRPGADLNPHRTSHPDHAIPEIFGEEHTDVIEGATDTPVGRDDDLHARVIAQHRLQPRQVGKVKVLCTCPVRTGGKVMHDAVEAEK